MLDREGMPQWLFADMIQTLGPDASKPVPLREEIQQIPVWRPCSEKVLCRAVRHLDPGALSETVHRVEARDEDPPCPGTIATGERDPFARGRKPCSFQIKAFIAE